ncbi:MAG: hypothetical protein G01um101416_794 [Microgenomates group bacterium Gr01-1014_16]|nr:MAG: hypothetical protein G01um101416_794 [Microgenomates group bacterium Gr01-1014_16]
MKGLMNPERRRKVGLLVAAVVSAGLLGLGLFGNSEVQMVNAGLVAGTYLLALVAE